METQNQTNLTSIKKLYISKRAKVLRDTFDRKNSNIQGFVSEVESSTFNATKDELLFARSLSWMQNSLQTECNIADLAKVLSVSVRKIQRLFSFFLDRTYTSVLLDMRIESAKYLLSQQKYSIGEVGFMVGIKDHAYFTYLFRKKSEMTPSEFRISLIQAEIA